MPVTQTHRQAIEQAVGREWSRIEADHPQLAALVDRDLLIRAVTAELELDPAYQQALARADQAHLASTTVETVITDFVLRWIRALL